MYNKFFGFREKPFQLVPNPQYLYLSRSHEETLAHLSYAVDQGDGFVAITGEVGTGKTTLCRVFLENLNETIEAAYIFNPKLDAIQLLKVVNDEFRISSAPDTVKELIDILNLFLIEKKREGKSVIILIDEAQNLSKEVLEQIRLLSNLETTTSKLIQIILVGQPELGEMLDSYELRQLGQRITLSCHLSPLSFKECCDYTNHRLHIASGKPRVRFARSALRRIYAHSGGVPRLINILCHRALLTAFVLEKRVVTGKIVRTTVEELGGSMDRPIYCGVTSGSGFLKRVSVSRIGVLAWVTTLGAILVMGVILKWNGSSALSLLGSIRSSDKVEISYLADEPEEGGQLPSHVSGQTAQGGPKLPPEFDSDFAVKSRSAVMADALLLWGAAGESIHFPVTIEDDYAFFMACANAKGFYVQRINSNFELVKKLDLPAILEFSLSGSEIPLYLMLKGTGDGLVLLEKGDGKGRTFTMDIDSFVELWTGRAYILWKDFSGCSGTIPVNAPEESVVALKMLLRDLGYKDIDSSKIYDYETMETIKTIQKKKGLAADGYVGTFTKIVLYNENKSLNIPHLIYHNGK